jgi:cytochrome c5
MGVSVAEHDDRIFARTFVIVMVGLTVLAVIIFALALFAGKMDKSVATGRAELDRGRLEANVAPVARVRVSEPAPEPAPVAEASQPAPAVVAEPEPVAEAPVAEEPVAQPAPVEPEPAVVAASNVTPGSQVNAMACSACHSIGVLNAPVTGNNEQWAALFADRGLDGLVHNAINGIRGMPPRGGNPRLTDDEVYNAVIHMLVESSVETGATER